MPLLFPCALSVSSFWYYLQRTRESRCRNIFLPEEMMRSVTILSAALISATLAVAQTQPSKPLTPSPVSAFEHELVNNQNQFMQAIAEQKPSAVNDSVAADFQGIGTNGDFYDREEFLSFTHEGLPKDLRVYNIHVVRLTDDSAVVTYNMIVPGARPRYRHMSDTWAKDGGKWKLKFQQYTPNLWSANDFD